MITFDEFDWRSIRRVAKDEIPEVTVGTVFLVTYFFLTYQVHNRFTIFNLIVTIVLILIRFGFGKEFTRDWFPLISFFVMYDLLRSLADDNQYIHVREPYEIEKILFGSFFGGDIPAFWLDRFQNPVLDFLTATLYSLHLFAPILLGYFLWKNPEDKRPFFEFTWTLTITSYLALLTFWRFPAAPPWWVWGHGFTQPTARFVPTESAAGLRKIDNFLGIDLFSQVYGTLNSNPFAAVPSLHAAYSFMVAFFAIRNYGKKAIPVVLYPIGVFFSAVYLKHHYIIDLIMGTTYALIASYVVTRTIYKPTRPKYTEDEIPIDEVHEEKYPVLDHLSNPGHNR